MRKFREFLGLPALVLIVSSTYPVQAYAYLDPGTGSFVIQMLLASLLGVALYIKMAWTSVKMFFRRLFLREEPESLLGNPEEKPGSEQQK